ncbi:MAG: sensor domain-containing diguanylate cyclase [Moritella sp.]|uniref:sensor domain-containing diguanylate cyclase n=1 Tax=unclassified Moritella TaxID=2637987 RepID=UPI0001568410|nr:MULTISPECIES: sensor domain-containing diguanylate cyclase [unclassified Moritella]EDM67650.1 GGDEF family protein [Moritella sp. PE36]MBL1415831.1 sensor domain-containing diguanylate cyclase [Moritella sp.]
MFDSQSCLSRAQQSIIDLDKWQQTVDLIAELFDSACGAIVQLRKDEFNVVVASQNEDSFLSRDVTWPWDINSFCRKIVETKQELNIQQAKSDAYWKLSPPVVEGKIRSYCGLPIFWPSGQLFGTICIIDTKETEYSPTLIKLLEQFCRLITADLQMLHDYEAIHDLALTDELTGLNNRRGLSFLGEQRIKDARRAKQTIGIVYLDIDNLKQINDKQGHQVGDQCIITLANVLKENGRESDIIARIGGDEFIIMTSFNDESIHDVQLEALCSRILECYNLAASEYDVGEITSISYGYQTFDYERTTVLEDMIAQADRLMYRNKNSKR